MFYLSEESACFLCPWLLPHSDQIKLSLLITIMLLEVISVC